MHKEFYRQWFGGFLDGCHRLDGDARERLLGACVRRFSVTLKQSVLRGDAYCAFRVEAEA